MKSISFFKYLFFVIAFYFCCSGFEINAEKTESTENNFEILEIPRKPFYFLRHGTTDWTPQNLDQGPQDLVINEKGKQEAELTAKILKLKIGLKNEEYVIISSTLKRARNTAEIISKEIKVPIILHAGLEERYFGDFSLNPEANIDCRDYIPADAESDIDFHKRISTTFNNLFQIEEIKNKKKIIVSHGEVFKYISTVLTGNSQSMIPRGDACIFVPNEDENIWSIQMLKN